MRTPHAHTRTRARTHTHAHIHANIQVASGAGAAQAPPAAGSGEIDENFIRLYWQQMLQVRGPALDKCGALTPLEQAVGGIHDLRIVL